MALTDAAISGDPPPTLDTAARRRAFVLPADGTAVGEARHLVLEQLRDWDITSDGCDTAVLVVSELFTNSVIHTNSEAITCNVGATDDQLLIQVADDGSGQTEPTPRQAHPHAEEGRGLMLVKALSERWGVAVAGQREIRVVWATLRLNQS
ncbi:ATP-binding protein [Streptomyces sp. NPDC050211]|uniref:ATP-binding protein n=1 Tax=Streptomyces sp. NPDC050211 TaxID=3154932 RepID=UPI00341AF365